LYRRWLDSEATTDLHFVCEEALVLLAVGVVVAADVEGEAVDERVVDQDAAFPRPSYGKKSRTRIS